MAEASPGSARKEKASLDAEPEAEALADAEPAAAAPADTSASDGVTFTSFAIQAGDVMSMRLRFGLSGSVRVPIEGMDDLDVDVTAQYEMKTEYLKVVDDKVVKYRVEYLKDQKRGTMMGADYSETSPLVGHAYLIDESGGGFVVRRADGRKVTPEEDAALRDKHADEKESGSDDEDYDFIPDRPIVVGEQLPLPEGTLKSLEGSAKVLSDIRLRFDGVRDHEGVPVGVFAIVGNVDSELPSVGRVRAKPRGELWIAVQGKYPTYIDVTASVDADVVSEGMKMKGNGTFLLGGAFGYERAGKR